MTVLLSKILVLIVFGTGYYQRVRDGKHVHELYRSRHDAVLGGYEQDTKYQWFVAQCTGQPGVVLTSERIARQFVESCPDPAAPAGVPVLPAPAHRRSFTIDLGHLPVDGPIPGFTK